MVDLIDRLVAMGATDEDIEQYLSEHGLSQEAHE